MKARIIIIQFVICLAGYGAYSQNSYNTAAGLRVNAGYGVTVKHNLNETASIEGILYSRWRGINITGLYQMNYPVFSEPGFRFYMGAGAHIGIWDESRNPWFDHHHHTGAHDHDNHVVIGIDGQIGLEYTFDEIPLNLSLDWKPAINLIGHTNFWGDDFGLSVRYAFK